MERIPNHEILLAKTGVKFILCPRLDPDEGSGRGGEASSCSSNQASGPMEAEAM